MVGLHHAQTLLALLLQAKKRSGPATSSTFTFLRHFGGLGLVPLAILDSTIIPTFGSLDLLTAWLAVGHPDLWLYYALMSTVGALIGAVITYRMGKKTGFVWIEKKIGHKRLEQIEHAIEHWGFGAIFVPTIAPPPCPTAWFFLVAGAFNFPQKKFIGAVVLGRTMRYVLLTLVAAHYGRRFLRYLRHPLNYLLVSLIITASLLAAVYLFGKRRATVAATPSIGD
jgi:membrane protein YqaA with SNARE-associated domain